MVSLFPWEGLDSTTPTQAEVLILQYGNLSRNTSGRGSRLPPPPSTASFQVSANYPHISKLSWVWTYPPPFSTAVFLLSGSRGRQRYSGGESRRAGQGEHLPQHWHCCLGSHGSWLRFIPTWAKGSSESLGSPRAQSCLLTPWQWNAVKKWALFPFCIPL